MANQESAVAVIEPQSASASVVEWELDDFPAEKFNRLLPMQTIVVPNDLMKPAYQVITADPPDRDGKSADTYSSNDVPKGHRAPTARLLRKFATAAGISFSDERRLDDGSDPEVMGVTMQASMVLPSGQRVSAPGSQLIDLRTWFKKDSSEAEVGKFRKQFYTNVATRAMSRAIRGLLGLRSSYPEAELAKPFLVVSYVLNMNHPDVRTRVLDALMPMTAQLYGGESAPMKQLASGDVTVSEAPADDPAPTPKQLPGEKLAKADGALEEPDWMREAPAKPASLEDRIRESAAAADDPDAPAAADELAALRTIFSGWDGKIVAAGIRAVWDGQAPNDLGSGQARAIAVVHDSMGHDAFERAWRNLAEKAQVAA